MSTTIETRVGALVTLMAAALQVELESSSVPVPKLLTAMPGSAVAFDYCDEGGMAWARLVSIQPIQSIAGSNCVTEYDVTVEVAILRCAPGIDEEGNLPSGEEQHAAFMLQMFDMGVLHKVLTCTPIPASYSSMTLGEYGPIGPDGGCIGGYWVATARFS